MTLAQAARQLLPTQSDPTRPYLLVSEGDLSADDKRRLASYPHPYIVILGLPRPKVGGWLNGDSRRRAVIDAILEHRPVNGVRPSRAPITELSYQVMRLRRFADELAPGIPLLKRLTVLSGTPVDPKVDDADVFTCTVRFVAYYRTTI